MSVLTDDIPFGPFEGVPIRGYSTRGSQARIHIDPTCSALRTVEVAEVSVPLNAASVKRMCRSCAESRRWARPTTSLGVFLDALTGPGLLHQLSSYTSDELADDLDELNIPRAAELLRIGEWPPDQDDVDADEDEDRYESWDEARSTRDTVLQFWLGAVESLQAAHQVIARYPWLEKWSRPKLNAKATCAEELKSAFAATVVPRNLVDVAAALLLDQPQLPVHLDEFAALPDPGRALAQLWTNWRRRLKPAPVRLEEHAYTVTYGVLDESMGKRRKGRAEAEDALHRLLSQWATAARARARESAERPARWLVVELPSPEGRAAHDTPLRESLNRWQTSVLAVHGMAVDWRRGLILLRLPDIVAQVLLEDRILRCEEVEQPEGDPAAWLSRRVREPESTAALPLGVLDDGPVADRRVIGATEAAALSTTRVGEHLYLVQTPTGVDVTYLEGLASRVNSGWRGVLLASSADVPASLVDEWVSKVGSWPEDKQFDPLGIEDGERYLAQLGRDVEADMRTLAIARMATDLRMIGTRDGRSPRRAVWIALLTAHQLDLTPFRSPEDEHPYYRRGLGLPLSVLAHVQLYTTNIHPSYGKGHSPYCGHARREGRVDLSYDLFTAADLLAMPEPDWCSKCGGYAVRRLDDNQLRYYRDAHRLLVVRDRLDRRHGEPISDDLREELDKLAEANVRRVDEYGPDRQQWSEVVRSLRRRVAADS